MNTGAMNLRIPGYQQNPIASMYGGALLSVLPDNHVEELYRAI